MHSLFIFDATVDRFWNTTRTEDAGYFMQQKSAASNLP